MIIVGGGCRVVVGETGLVIRSSWRTLSWPLRETIIKNAFIEPVVSPRRRYDNHPRTFAFNDVDLRLLIDPYIDSLIGAIGIDRVY